MTPILRAALAGCASTALATVSLAQTPPPLPIAPQHIVHSPVAVPAPPSALPPGFMIDAPVWPQVRSDIRPDPDVRFGQLTNGMRYAVMHNATPPHETSIRLRIGSGSLNEKDDQLGLAHFLEHMAFKGSAHVPEGEMVKLLQRHGLAFGPDTNAFTNFTSTIYQLDLPENDEGSVDLGLMLMRETASELNLDPKALEPERGVVLSEERVRDTPGYEAGKRREAFLMRGQLAPARLPIGSVDVIRHAPASRLRDFYQANYRPERATLIVVGDIDVDQVEAKIKARFNEWKGVGPAAAEPVYGAVQPRGLEAQVIVQPGTTTNIQVSWTGPHDAAPDTRAKEKRDLIAALGLTIINRRLSRLAQGDNPPFVSASVGRSDRLRSIRTASLTVTPKGDDWQGALTAADTIRRQALQYGVQPGELERVIAEARTRIRGTIGGAASRPTPNIAQQILADVDNDEVFAPPIENVAIFEEAVKDLKPEQVDAALRSLFSGNGPLISMIAAASPKGDEAALIETFQKAEAAPVAPAAVIQTIAWPYTDFGAPGVVVEKQEAPEFGVTFVRFANGATLAFKHTSFRKDQVLIAFDMPGGVLAVPRGRLSPAWASSALTLGGTAKIAPEDADQALTGKQHDISARVLEQDFALMGNVRRFDLDTEMQYLTAYLSDPAWRPAALARVKSFAGLALAQTDSTPQGVFGRNIEALLHPGDTRWVEPTPAGVEATLLSDVRALWDPALRGQVDVVMVGDLTLDQAIAAAAKTVGALPTRAGAAPVPPGARDIHFPPPNAEPVRLTHRGRADQAIAYIAWPTTDYYANPQEARQVSLMVQVFENRLIERVRIAEGATYSPSAGSRPSDYFPGYGLIAASVETPPDRLGSFYRNVAEITAELRDHRITADELERAKKPRIEQIQKAQETNEYWMGRLTDAGRDRRGLEISHQTIPGYQSISIEEVEAVARKYLRDETAFKVVVVPEGWAGAVKP